MIWRKISRRNASKIVERIKEGDIPQVTLDESYQRMRSCLCQAWSDVNEEIKSLDEKSRLEYMRDLRFGLRLYAIFSKGEFAMTPRIAADIDIWRYISLNVVPEIVIERWPKESSWDDRFFQKTNRIYLKVLWWYIYLSWQGDDERTYAVLEANTEDTIAQLVERSGSHGYNINLYRKIMIRHFCQGESAQSMVLFRKVMKLHTARIRTRQPEMLPGGVNQYVEELYAYFNE
ncbi:DUF6339 family protein [Selenomonas ruminantium]|uniref:Uncharacterized protein n=1 Tax=Selenomonas ruminantium TaxID=971 RepID=A0A1H3YWS3_SELRU|nr:DUF6339 family protein [Selenomonas ruminantium]SEA15548.1 hypothetical protein SAMN05660648_02162 [Selenomonas ruminantium]